MIFYFSDEEYSIIYNVGKQIKPALPPIKLKDVSVSVSEKGQEDNINEEDANYLENNEDTAETLKSNLLDLQLLKIISDGWTSLNLVCKCIESYV